LSGYNKGRDGLYRVAKGVEAGVHIVNRPLNLSGLAHDHRVHILDDRRFVHRKQAVVQSESRLRYFHEMRQSRHCFGSQLSRSTFDDRPVQYSELFPIPI
jgi:hypothetical protein